MSKIAKLEIPSWHGLAPQKYRVLIKPDKVEEKIGNIYIPEQTQERDQHAAMEGELVAMSPIAFDWDRWPEDHPKPQVGSRVVINKYSGVIVKGNDGEEYRVMNDEDVLLVRAS
jgi:chaperonin GroES